MFVVVVVAVVDTRRATMCLFASSQLVQSSTMATFGRWKTRPRSTHPNQRESVEKRKNTFKIIADKGKHQPTIKK
jgi:hypothetical protein